MRDRIESVDLRPAWSREGSCHVCSSRIGYGAHDLHPLLCKMCRHRALVWAARRALGEMVEVSDPHVARKVGGKDES